MSGIYIEEEGEYRSRYVIEHSHAGLIRAALKVYKQHVINDPDFPVVVTELKYIKELRKAFKPADKKYMGSI